MSPASLLPRTLGGRTLLLVVATVLLSEALTFYVLEHFRQAYVAQRGADLVVGYVRVMQSAVDTMPAAARHAFAARASAEARVRVVAGAQATPPAREPTSALRQAMAARIRHELGLATAIRAPVDVQGRAYEMWVSFAAGGEPWWLVVPAGRLEMPLPWALVGILGALLATAMLLAAGFVRGIVRPLRELQDATGALGAGQPRPVTPAGPRETRHLAERFNAMLAQLEANERERSVMLAGLPHDLRAPLTRLRLRLAMLDDSAREGLQRDAADIDRIANQFIAYLRGAWSADAPRAAVALRPLLDERAAHYRQQGHRLEVHGDTTLTVRADPDALVRLLDNLIDNALRYGAEPVELAVAAAADGARLTVRDHGPGIPPAEVARALQPFTRLDAARSGSGQCGLGLAIVDRIARAHGGQLRLQPASGGGLCAAVLLPAG